MPFAGKTFSTASRVQLVDPCNPNDSCSGSGALHDPRFDAGASAWQTEPWAETVHIEAAARELPLWNASQGIGTPLAGNAISAVFSPILAVFHLHPTPLVQDLTFLFALLLTGAAAYAFARSLSLRPLSATLVGSAFALSGWFFVYGNNQFTETYLFLPLCLALVEWTVRRRSLIFPALLACSLAGAVSAGMPEIYFMCFIVVGLYASTRLFTGPRAGGRGLVVARLAGGAAIGAVIAAPAIVTFAEFLPLSQNTHSDLVGTATKTEPLGGLLTWLAPRLTAGSVGYSGGPNWIGAGVTTLAFVGLSSRRMIRRYVLLPMIVAAGLIGLQIYSGAFADLTKRLPYWSQSNWQPFGTPIIALALAVFAGVGLQVVVDKEIGARNVAGAVAALVALCAALLVFGSNDYSITQNVFLNGGWPSAAIFGLLIALIAVIAVTREKLRAVGLVVIVLVIVELLVIAPRGFYADRADPFPRRAWIEFLQDHTGADASRVFSTDGVLFPDTAGAYGLRDPRMLDALYPKRYWRYLRAFVSKGIVDRFTATGPAESAPAVAANPMFDLLGVRYLVYDAHKNTGPPSWAYLQYRQVYADDDVKIYENANVTPRAFIAHDHVRAADMDAAIAYLRDGETVHFPDGSVQVKSKDPIASPVIESSRGDQPSEGTCSGAGDQAAITDYGSSSVTIEVDSECAGLLVLTDQFFPGWTASVNGHDRPIYATNVAFRGVPVPAGRSTVTFTYEPPLFRAAFAASTAALVGVGVLIAVVFVRRRRRRRRRLGPVRLRDTPTPDELGRAVFLDRDGVLNAVGGDGTASISPRSVDDLRIVDGAKAAVDRLRAAGWRLIVVTNQPDVARGDITAEAAVAITEAVVDGLELDDGYVCTHDGVDKCPCRKPGTGMLLQAATDWNIDLAGSWLIGDRWVDLGAAQGAGARSVLLETSYSWAPAGGNDPPGDLDADVVVRDLTAAVDAVLSAGARGEQESRRADGAAPQPV